MNAALRSAAAAALRNGRWSAIPLLAVACTVPHPMQVMIDQTCSARRGDGPPFPQLQKHFPSLDESAAYEVQKACTRRLQQQGERIIGYKAGLTGPGQPVRFGLSREALGVLLHSMRLQPSAAGVHRAPVRCYHRPMIEMEAALLLGEDLRAPLADVAALKRVTAGVAAAVELPDLGFAGGGLPGGLELAASNVAARHFILGPAHPPQKVDLDALQAELRHDGRAVRRGRGADLALPQWEMARRLLNRILEEGYRPMRGQVLLTGALGGLHPGEPGEYEADFGALGVIRFALPSEAEASP